MGAAFCSKCVHTPSALWRSGVFAKCTFTSDSLQEHRRCPESHYEAANPEVKGSNDSRNLASQQDTELRHGKAEQLVKTVGRCLRGGHANHSYLLQGKGAAMPLSVRFLGGYRPHYEH